MIRCMLIKSRTNKAGQTCDLIYNQESGFDPVMTLYRVAKDNNKVGGTRKNNKYFIGHEDVKFNETTFTKCFLEDEKVRFALHDTVMPLLHAHLSKVDSDKMHDINKSLGELGLIEPDFEVLD